LGLCYSADVRGVKGYSNRFNLIQTGFDPNRTFPNSKKLK
jgi:hypothetical protein